MDVVLLPLAEHHRWIAASFAAADAMNDGLASAPTTSINVRIYFS